MEIAFWVRILLLLGLASHKFLWEYLKVQGGHAQVKDEDVKTQTRIIKGVKTGVLLGFFIQTAFFDSLFPFSVQPTALRLVGLGIFAAGWIIAVRARLELGDRWSNVEDSQVPVGKGLVTSGVYSVIRHPLYLGDILLVLGLELALNSWLVLGTIFPILYSVKQAIKEEQLLEREFPEYGEYRARTKRFIPFVF